MDELRWILLGVAVVFVFAVYFFSRTRRKESARSPIDAANDMPSFSAGDELEDEWVHGVGPVRVVSRSEDDDVAVKPMGKIQPERNVTRNPEPVRAPQVESRPAPAPRQQTSAPLKEAFQFGDESVSEVRVVSRSAPEEPPEEPVIPEPWEEPVSEPETLDTRPVDVPEEPAVEQTPLTEPEAATGQAPGTSPGEEVDDVVAVYVLGTEENPIKGEQILSASYALKLEHGEMYIFHRYSEDRNRKILFSMANVLEPGWFDIEKINQIETRGVSFFMQVNLVDNPSRVLDDMLICAHSMATMMGAKLCNPHREPLDEAYTNGLRERVRKLAEIKSQTA